MPESDGRPASVRRAVVVLAWTALWLGLADVAVGRVFRPPANPRVEPTTLQRYFDYGRSVEGKLRKMVQPRDDESAPIVEAGWLKNPEFEQRPRRPKDPAHIFVASYGQSFTRHIVDEAVRIDPMIEVREEGGPGSPLSHSYALYQQDRHNHEAKVVVLGVLASVLPQMATLTPITWGFESPSPYTYPRYRIVDGKLVAIPAPIETLDEFRATLADPTRWSAFRQLLATQDAAFDSFSFDEDLLDRSIIGKLVRRALGHQRQAEFTARYHTPRGFTNEDQILDVSRALLIEFGRTAVADGRLPFVFLFDDRGYAGHLDAAFGATLKKAGIPYLTSDTWAPASNLSNFLPDGHFTPAIDTLITKQWLAQVHQLLDAPKPAPVSP